MPPVNMDILGKFFGSAQDPIASSEATHKSAVDKQVQNDLTNSLKEFSQNFQRTATAQMEYQNEFGKKNVDLESIIKSTRADIIKEVQGTLEDSGYSPYKSATGARSIVNQIEKNPEDVNKALDDLSDKLNNVSKHAKGSAASMHDWLTILAAGGGGGMIASGMMAGNPIRMAEGALVAGSSIWQAEGLGKKVQAGTIAAGAALVGFGDEAIQMAPQVTSQAMQQQRELIRGGNTSASQFYNEMGLQGNMQVLTTEQKLQMSKTFADTGGGSTADLERVMEKFAQYTLVYGDAAMSMMQATRKLDMWIPQGQFSKEMGLMTSELKAKGFAPEQIQETLQAMVPMMIKQTQMGRSVSEIGQGIETTEGIATGLGMGGAQAVQAVQGYQGMFKNALQNPSLYAFLTEKAKITRARALAIANGAPPQGDELEHIAEALKDSFRGVGGGAEGMEAQKVMLSQMTSSMGMNEATTEQLSRQMGLSKGTSQAGSKAGSEAHMINKIYTQQSGGMSVLDTQVSREQTKILMGLEAHMQTIAKSVFMIQAAADKAAGAVGYGGVTIGEVGGNMLRSVIDGGKALRVKIVGNGNDAPVVPKTGKKH